MKKIFLIGALAAMFTTPALSAEIGVGGGHQDGHSWSGRYSVDQGYMGYVTAESDRYKGFTFGGQYTFRQYTTTINGDGGKDLERKQITAHALTGVVRYYPVERERDGDLRAFQPFAGILGGYEIATDADAFVTGGQAGLDVWFNSNLAIEAAYTYWVRPADRNYKTAAIGLKLTF